MIKINDDYECERDKYQWILHHWTDGRDKDGNQKRVCHDTYHANLTQVCNLVLDRAAGNAGCADELRDIIRSHTNDILAALPPND